MIQRIASDPRLPANPTPTADYLTRQNIRLTEILRQQANTINELGYVIEALGNSLRSRNSEISYLRNRLDALEQTQMQKTNLTSILQRLDSLEQLTG